ncbi:FUSC family protein [Microbacterium sp. YY-01]|uniref:FUSC family protein n=1 Tax=Microbacterium sp. YY-01 TaxID=3421634 RepID=UPI003D163B76
MSGEPRITERAAAFQRRITSSARVLLQPAHLLLAAKSAATATLGWALGGLLPGDFADYAYYAPLGALVAMAPTVASSVISSVKAIIGVGAGLAVAWTLIFSGVHGIVALFLAIAIASILSGIAWLGPGKAYIPFTAAFVFLSGGSEPGEFSIGLAAQFVLGAGLGIIANVLLPPPVRPQEVHEKVLQARYAFASCVQGTGDVVASGVSQAAQTDLVQFYEAAQSALHEARDAVQFADHNRRGNVRARRADTDLSRDKYEITAIDDSLHDLLSITKTPGDLPDHDSGADDPDAAQLQGISKEYRRLFTDGCRMLKTCIERGAWAQPHRDAQMPGKMDEVWHSVHELTLEGELMEPRAREWLFTAVRAMRRTAQKCHDS